MRNGPPYDSILYEGLQQAMGEEGEKNTVLRFWKCEKDCTGKYEGVGQLKKRKQTKLHIERLDGEREKPLQEFRDGFFCDAM